MWWLTYRRDGEVIGVVVIEGNSDPRSNACCFPSDASRKVLVVSGLTEWGRGRAARWAWERRAPERLALWIKVPSGFRSFDGGSKVNQLRPTYARQIGN
jgi:hypothetical protein